MFSFRERKTVLERETARAILVRTQQETARRVERKRESEALIYIWALNIRTASSHSCV